MDEERKKLESSYQYPTDKLILEELEKFKDLKLGFMTHIGMYSQMGIIESWALSDEKERGSWSQWGIDWTDIESFKKQYFDLNKSFNPMRFDPERWAKTISRNCFKYAIIPTKHHDGYCLWDTQYTDYKTTNTNYIFSKHKYADMFDGLVTCLKNEGIKTGAYFSKVDWKHEGFWPEEFKVSGNTHKNVGYSIEKQPELWESYKEFTKNQMHEIVKNYHNIDIMWIDGGWLSKELGEDLEMELIMDQLRIINPGLIMVDRYAGGLTENYITPEQKIPSTYIDVPWESCISLGGGFNYAFEDNGKSAAQIAKIFVEILCKGGNLLLNVSPQPDGRLANEAIYEVNKFGQWVEENQSAIFETRPIAPYWNENCGLVKAKNGEKYLFVLWDMEDLITPKYIYFSIDYEISKIVYKGQITEFKNMGDRYRVTIPASEIDSELPICLVFKVE